MFRSNVLHKLHFWDFYLYCEVSERTTNDNYQEYLLRERSHDRGRVQGRLWSLKTLSRPIINVILDNNNNAWIFVRKISSVILIEVE